MRFILTLLLAAAAASPSVAGPVSPSSCPGCILNTASQQNAIINIGTATIRGTLTVSTLNVTNLAITNLTATNIIGAGAGITALNASALASGTVPSARVAGAYTGITQVGTLTAGTWNGDVVGTQYGGTGKNWSTVNVGALPYFDATGSMTTLAAGASNRLLQANGAGAPSWTAAPTVLGTNITAIPLANLSNGTLPSGIAVQDASLSVVSGVKVSGDISGNAENINGTLALAQLGPGTLAADIIAQSIVPSGVTPGTYGGPQLLAQFTVGTDGRVTNAVQFSVPALSTSSAANDIDNAWKHAQTSFSSWTILSTLYADTLLGDGSGLTGVATDVELAAEAAARVAADNVLSASTESLRSDLSAETAARIAADMAIGVDTDSLRTDLSAETAARIAADLSIGVDTASLRTDLTAETAARIAADANLNATKLNASSYTFNVAPSGGDYSTLAAAVAGVSALGLPAGTTVNFIIHGGFFVETPIVLPNRWGITGLRGAALIYNSASPAITVIGNASMNSVFVQNIGGPGMDVVSSSGTTLVNSSFIGASGYGLRVASGTHTINTVAAQTTAGHGLWVSGNANIQAQILTAQTSGSGHAMLITGSGSGSFMNSTFNGHNSFSAIMLSTGAPRFQNVAICAKAGQHAIDAAFPTTSGIGSGLITYTNSCVGGGGLSQTLGNNVVFFPNQAIQGVVITNAAPPAGALLVVTSTSSMRWETSAEVAARLAFLASLDSSTQTLRVDVDALDASKVNRAGDTMTGSLTVDEVADGSAAAYDIPSSPPLVNFLASSSGTITRDNSAAEAWTAVGGGVMLSAGFGGVAPAFTGLCADGTEASPLPCASGSIVTFIGAKPYDGSNPTSAVGSNSAFTLRASETSSPSGRGMLATIETTTNGTTTRRQRVTVNDTGWTAIAPRSNTVTPLGLLHLKANDAGIGITGNQVALYAEEAIVSLSSVTATDFFGGGANLTSLTPANLSAGELPANVIASSVAATGVTVGSYGSATESVQLTIGVDGRISSASNVTVTPAAASIQAGTLGSTVIASSVAATGVTPGSYGSASEVGTFTVDGDGRLSAAGNTSIAIAQSQVTDLVSDLAAKASSGTDSSITRLTALTTIDGPATSLSSFTVNADILASGASSDVRADDDLIAADDLQVAGTGHFQEKLGVGMTKASICSTCTVHVAGNISATGTIQAGTVMFNDGSSMTTAPGGEGSIAQVFIASSTAPGTGTTDMIWDTSIPQITEGDQVLAATMTPTAASSWLNVHASAWVAEETNVSASGFICCVFRDSNPDALLGSCRANAVASNAEISTEHFNYEVDFSTTANAATTTNFSIRCGLFGAGAGGVLGWNGSQGGSQKLGGSMGTQIKVMEIRK